MQYVCQLKATTWRMEKLNEVLPPLQKKFEESLSNGVLLELTEGDIAELAAALADGPA